MLNSNLINSVFLGDNLDLLKKLNSNIFNLIYIDPPYYSQKDYKEFSDVWNSLEEYLDFLKLRIEQIHRVLKNTGSFYLQCDQKAVHYLKILCDQVFGFNNFRSGIVWKRSSSKGNSSKIYVNTIDFLLFYTKSNNFTFNQHFTELKESSVKRYNKIDDKGKFMETVITSMGMGSKNKWDFGIGEIVPRKQDRGYAYSKERIQKEIKNGIIYKSKRGYLVKRRYLSESKGVPLSCLWNDISYINKKEKLGYPTQKPVKLLKRIINVSSNENDLIGDFFCGSGTTLFSAQKLNRNWIGIDFNLNALKICKNRLNCKIFKI